MRLFIIRHGETPENRGQILQGQSPTRLSDVGQAQARALAARFNREHLDALYSSDLPRALETAEAIATVKGVEVRRHEGLRERNHGVFQGRAGHEFESSLRTSGEPEHLFRPQGGETLSELELRVITAVQEIASRHSGETIAVVSHSGPIRTLLHSLLRTSHPHLFPLKQQNSCVNLLKFDGPGTAVPVLINCVTHLSEHGLRALGMYE